jgi:Domain of unknown function (DUF5666)
MLMRKLLQHRVTFIFLCVIALASYATAHGNEKHVMGTVTKVESGAITVQTPNAGEKTVDISSATKFMKGQSAATQQDIKVGDRVVIHAKANGDKLEATEVRIGSPNSYDKKPK